MTKIPAAPKNTRHPVPRGDEQNNDPMGSGLYQQGLFLAMALNMTWQLAIVVFVPIVGGYFLDQHYHTSPWLAVAGVLAAVLGVAGVLYKVVADAGRRNSDGITTKGKK